MIDKKLILNIRIKFQQKSVYMCSSMVTQIWWINFYKLAVIGRFHQNFLLKILCFTVLNIINNNCNVSHCRSNHSVHFSTLFHALFWIANLLQTKWSSNHIHILTCVPQQQLSVKTHTVFHWLNAIALIAAVLG